jgi:hypothetical protein
LAIAKHIVQVHDGEIWAEPNVPMGTVFVFRMPIAGPGAHSLTPELANPLSHVFPHPLPPLPSSRERGNRRGRKS